MKPILIALVSPAGSTQEIAGALAEAFKTAGRPVELTDLTAPKDLGSYSAVVVAAPIHGMRWMPEAVAWVEAHQGGLRARPCALVAVSYLYFAGRSSWQGTIRKGLEAVRAPLPHSSLQIFPGRLPSALPTPARWLFGVKKIQPLDLVDLKAVTAWAQDWVRTVP